MRRYLSDKSDAFLQDPRKIPAFDTLGNILQFYQSYRVLERQMAMLRPRRGTEEKKLDAFHQEVKLRLL